MWVRSPEEDAFYGRMFALADVEKNGKVQGKKAVDFFTTSGLAPSVLKQVWSLASSKMQPYLDQDEFNVALGLIALAQKGETLDLAALVAAGRARHLPLPVFHLADIFVMTPSDEEKYASIFRASAPSGTIVPTDAIELFQKSGLALADVHAIYKLVDPTLSTPLPLQAFTIAMHVIVCKTRRGLTHLPASVPREWFPTLFSSSLAQCTSADDMLSAQASVQAALQKTVMSLPAVVLPSVSSIVAPLQALGYHLPDTAMMLNESSLRELEGVLLTYVQEVQKDLQSSSSDGVPLATLVQTLSNLKTQSARLLEQKEAALSRQGSRHPDLLVNTQSSSSFVDAPPSFPAPTAGWDAFEAAPAPIMPTQTVPEPSLFSPTGAGDPFGFDLMGGTGGSFTAPIVASTPVTEKPVLDAFASASSSSFSAFDAMNDLDWGFADNQYEPVPELDEASEVTKAAPKKIDKSEFFRTPKAPTTNMLGFDSPSFGATTPTPEATAESAFGVVPAPGLEDFGAFPPTDVPAFGSFAATADADGFAAFTTVNAPTTDGFQAFGGETLAGDAFVPFASSGVGAFAAVDTPSGGNFGAFSSTGADGFGAFEATETASPSFGAFDAPSEAPVTSDFGAFTPASDAPATDGFGDFVSSGFGAFDAAPPVDDDSFAAFTNQLEIPAAFGGSSLGALSAGDASLLTSFAFSSSETVSTAPNDGFGAFNESSVVFDASPAPTPEASPPPAGDAFGTFAPTATLATDGFGAFPAFEPSASSDAVAELVVDTFPTPDEPVSVGDSGTSPAFPSTTSPNNVNVQDDSQAPAATEDGSVPVHPSEACVSTNSIEAATDPLPSPSVNLGFGTTPVVESIAAVASTTTDENTSPATVGALDASLLAHNELGAIPTTVAESIVVTDANPTAKDFTTPTALTEQPASAAHSSSSVSLAESPSDACAGSDRTTSSAPVPVVASDDNSILATEATAGQPTERSASFGFDAFSSPVTTSSEDAFAVSQVDDAPAPLPATESAPVTEPSDASTTSFEFEKLANAPDAPSVAAPALSTSSFDVDFERPLVAANTATETNITDAVQAPEAVSDRDGSFVFVASPSAPMQSEPMVVADDDCGCFCVPDSGFADFAPPIAAPSAVSGTTTAPVSTTDDIFGDFQFAPAPSFAAFATVPAHSETTVPDTAFSSLPAHPSDDIFADFADFTSATTAANWASFSPPAAPTASDDYTF